MKVSGRGWDGERVGTPHPERHGSAGLGLAVAKDRKSPEQTGPLDLSKVLPSSPSGRAHSIVSLFFMVGPGNVSFSFAPHMTALALSWLLLSASALDQGTEKLSPP